MVPITRPDMMILDLGLPDLDGVDVTRSLREWSPIPIIVLSVRSEESDKVVALDAGADDYISKAVRRQRVAGPDSRRAQACRSG